VELSRSQFFRFGGFTAASAVLTACGGGSLSSANSSLLLPIGEELPEMLRAIGATQVIQNGLVYDISGRVYRSDGSVGRLLHSLSEISARWKGSPSQRTPLVSGQPVPGGNPPPPGTCIDNGNGTETCTDANGNTQTLTVIASVTAKNTYQPSIDMYNFCWDVGSGNPYGFSPTIGPIYRASPPPEMPACPTPQQTLQHALDTAKYIIDNSEVYGAALVAAATKYFDEATAGEWSGSPISVAGAAALEFLGTVAALAGIQGLSDIIAAVLGMGLIGVGIWGFYELFHCLV